MVNQWIIQSLLYLSRKICLASFKIEMIGNLAQNFRPSGCKKLKGQAGCRVRKGDSWIIYDIYDDVLMAEVVALGHRLNIYE